MSQVDFSDLSGVSNADLEALRKHYHAAWREEFLRATSHEDLRSGRMKLIRRRQGQIEAEQFGRLDQDLIHPSMRVEQRFGPVEDFLDGLS